MAYGSFFVLSGVFTSQLDNNFVHVVEAGIWHLYSFCS